MEEAFKLLTLELHNKKVEGVEDDVEKLQHSDLA